MDLEVVSSPLVLSPLAGFVKCCNCGCNCSLMTAGSSAGSWIRSVKRKYDEFEQGSVFFISGLDSVSNARVQIENECAALRETVGSQQKAIQDLYTELEEERNASSSAANETMSMILRLQREKAEIQMDSRQFKRVSEEKMAHDQEEILLLEDLLYKREQTIQSLTYEMQAYKHRMMSYGFTEMEFEGEKGEQRGFGFGSNGNLAERFDAAVFEYPGCDYPPLKCNLNGNIGTLEEEDDVVDVEKYPFGETPRGCNQLKNLEHGICQMERNPSHSQLLDVSFSGTKNILEKVVVGQSPRRLKHGRKFSTDSLSSFIGPSFAAESPRYKAAGSFLKTDYVSPKPNDGDLNVRKMDNVSDFGDDSCDRVCTIDSVHNDVLESKTGLKVNDDDDDDDDDMLSSEALNQADANDPDIKKLNIRLQALEADREFMRQAIISMKTDKSQLILLKEIAQRLCKEIPPERQLHVKKASFLRTFSIIAVFKWMLSFILWRKRAGRCKYMFGLSPSEVGLLMLLDKAPRRKAWRCLTSTQV